MRRRQFLGSTAVATATLANFPGESEAHLPHATTDAIKPTARWFDPTSTWHFFDRWHFDHLDQVSLKLGRPRFQSEATFETQPIGNLASWPTVYRDSETGIWKMLYSADWKPFQLMLAESEDGKNWRQARPDPLFTLPGGSGGAVYQDPVAEDGFPFKVFVHQQGAPAHQAILQDPSHPMHAIATRDGQVAHVKDEFTLVSRDGLTWQPRRDLRWSRGDWHPEPPIFSYYHRRQKQHVMTVRPGWGDRRLCRQETDDFQNWSEPSLLMQPDFGDRQLIELYGMPVFAYGDGYVGFPWVFHPASAEPTRGFNRFYGPVHSQIAFSHDGYRFDRVRQPFLEVGRGDEPFSGAIQPSCLVETEDELRIYSSASRVHHGRGSDAKRRGIESASITLHTLRKDGLTYLETMGDQGRMISKPLALFSDQLRVSAAAEHGEIRFQITDMESRPVEGFTFDDCHVFASDDSTDFAISWRDASLADLRGKIVRLEFRLRHARLYAIRGKFRFIDAQGRSLIQAGHTIPPP